MFIFELFQTAFWKEYHIQKVGTLLLPMLALGSYGIFVLLAVFFKITYVKGTLEIWTQLYLRDIWLSVSFQMGQGKIWEKSGNFDMGFLYKSWAKSRLGISWMTYSRYGFSQWETTLHCNVATHWLSPYLEWPLIQLLANPMVIHVYLDPN